MVGEYNKNTILWKGRVVGLPARGGEGADYPCPYAPQVLGKILLKNSNLELVLCILVFYLLRFCKGELLFEVSGYWWGRVYWQSPGR